MLVFTVSDADDGARLDQWLATKLGCSRREAQRLLADGSVRLGGTRASKGERVRAGQRVQLETEPPTATDKRPQPQPELPLVVVHIDDALLAMVKPVGMPTHPLRAGERGTLANALVARHPECADVAEDPREGGLAHRLDIDTSGIIVAARSRAAWTALRHAFHDGAVVKDYLALVAGNPPEHGRVDGPLAHAGAKVRVAAIGERDALPASTRFHTLARGGGLALVRATSSSGRMHQIRAHLAHAGFPLVGDALYGGPPAVAGTSGHFLHAEAMRLPHPTTGASLTLRAPLPPDRAQALRALFGWHDDNG